MNNPNRNVPSFDDLLQEQRRKQAAQNLAQSILGSRSRTPAGAARPQGIGASIASRSGVQRRPVSLPRTNSAPASRITRLAPPPANMMNSRRQDTRPRDPYPQQQEQQSFPRPANGNAKINGRPAAREPVANSFNVRGAAKGEQFIVVGENFAVDTTAADIEAVMHDVGGELHSCRIISINPVVAEMSFMDRQGAQTVIDTFDGKKADSNTLCVYWKGQRPSRQPSPDAVGFVVDTEPTPDDVMEVDEHTRDREEQNRLREERRGAAPRGPANDHGGRNGGYPSGPSADRRGQYDSRNSYNDRRYPNGGGGGGGGGRRYDGGGRGGGRQYPQNGQSYQS